MTASSSTSKLFVLPRCLTLLFVVLNVTVAFTVNPTQSLTSRHANDPSDSCASSLSSSSSSSDTSSTTNSASSSSSMPPKIPLWFQHEITITAPSRGCHLVTADVQKAISSDLSQIKIGLCNLFIQHTSASLTINENADPDVRRYVPTILSFWIDVAGVVFGHKMEY